MFDIGMPELFVIFIVALLVLGPKKLPELGRALGRGLGELKKALQEVKDTVGEEFTESASEIRDAVSDVKKQITTEVSDAGKTIDKSFQEVKKEMDHGTAEINKTLGSTVQDTEEQSEPEAPETGEHSDDAEVKKNQA
jgi:sec-independent protein translocase protein TatB